MEWHLFSNILYNKNITCIGIRTRFAYNAGKIQHTLSMTGVNFLLEEYISENM